MSVAFQIPACAENRRREKHLEYARSHVTSVTCVARNDLLFTMSDNTRAGALWGTGRANLFFSRTRLRSTGPPYWWSQTGSNRRPPACKAGALPTELWPRSYGTEAEAGMVGLGRFELPTSRLSSARSNQLSYRPIEARVRPSHRRPRAIVLQRRLDSVGSSEKKEKRRRRNPANGSVRPDIERP